MKILVTGFQPFNGRDVNPTELLLEALKAPEGVLLIKKLLPVEFKKAEKELKQIVEEEIPDVILSLGQAGNVPNISIESVAINKDSCLSSDAKTVLPDMTGFAPIDEPIISGGPDAYFSKLPIIKILNAVNKTGVKARISYSAGTYVCNHIMYIGCHLASQFDGMQSGFVHVPFLPEQLDGKTEEKGRYSMPFCDMLLGVQTIINELVEELSVCKDGNNKQKKVFKRFIRKTAVTSFFNAFFISGIFTTGILAVVSKQMYSVVDICIYLAFAFLFTYFYKKNKTYFIDLWKQLSTETRQIYLSRLDKCKKRFINSFFILLFAIAYFIMVS